MTFLEQLRAANIERDKEWANGDKPFSLIFFANELAGEVGEACNILKKLDREHNYGVRGSRATIEQLTEELADIVICCDLIGMQQNLEFNPVFWPAMNTERLTEHHYSDYGVRLMANTGRICGIAMYYFTHINSNHLLAQLHELLSDVKKFSGYLGIDINRAVAQKFNATSEKVGLATRFILEDRIDINFKSKDLIDTCDAIAERLKRENQQGEL